jgi:hypothetical protein
MSFWMTKTFKEKVKIKISNDTISDKKLSNPIRNRIHSLSKPDGPINAKLIRDGKAINIEGGWILVMHSTRSVQDSV